MDSISLVADLFGNASASTLRLVHPVSALRALLRSPRVASCDGVAVVSDQPIQGLCGALVAAGRPDSAMQVVDRSGAAVCFVASIHDAARSRPA